MMRPGRRRKNQELTERKIIRIGGIKKNETERDVIKG